MKQYIFSIVLYGVGNTVEEALKDAFEHNDPENPEFEYDYDIRDIPEKKGGVSDAGNERNGK
jgi:hypothetical protein